MKFTNPTPLSISAIAILVLAACNKPTTRPSLTSSDGSSSTAPAGITAKAADKALVRFINATPAPKDLRFGELAAFSNVPPMNASPYRELPANGSQFKLFNAGNLSDPLAINDEDPSAGLHYTIVAMNGTDGQTILSPVRDKIAEIAPGKAKVRVIHAASGVKKVDIYPAGTNEPLVDGVAFKEATGYKEVNPVLTEIALRTTDSKSGAVTLRNLTLEPGKLYTLVIMGGNGQPLVSKVIEDQVMQSLASFR